jgi:hypothetical protein
MTQANRLGAAGVTPGAADASAYAPLRRPVFRALWIASGPPTPSSVRLGETKTSIHLARLGGCLSVASVMTVGCAP